MANSDDEDLVYFQEQNTFPLKRVSSVDIAPEDIASRVLGGVTGGVAGKGRYTVNIFERVEATTSILIKYLFSL